MNSYKANMKKETRQTGFTLVELLVTMAVMIITLAVGVPFYNSVVANNRATTQANMIVTAMNLAKSEAIARGETVVVCADSNGNPADYACGTSSDWPNGWFVYSDIDGDSTIDSDEIIKVWQSLDGNPVITASVGTISFSSQGVTGAAVQFALSQDGTTGNQDRCLTMNQLGRISITRSACP